MNVEPKIKLTPEWLAAGKYIIAHSSPTPRLTSRDAEIWARLHPLVTELGWWVRYDLDLGLGGQLPPGISDADAAMWKQLTVRRADICLFRRDALVVIEIKPFGQADLVGQMELDIHASLETPLVDVPVEWIGVCNHLDRHASGFSSGRQYTLVEIGDTDTLRVLLGDSNALVL